MLLSTSVFLDSSCSHSANLPFLLIPQFFHSHENLSPLRLRYGTLASYLLFSPTLCASSSGACLVGAGSTLACELGLPSSYPPSAPAPSFLSLPTSLVMLRGAVVDVGFKGVVAVRVEGLGDMSCSSCHWRMRFWRSASAFAARSAFMLRLAKK